MSMHEFAYHRPETLTQAVDLRSHRPDGRFLAGGQTLIPAMKQALTAPTDLFDLASLTDLRGIELMDDGITIGAMSCHADVAGSDIVRRRLPALAQLAAMIGDAQVRNRGTIGGSLANSDPAADYPAAVMALDAMIHTDRRAIAAHDFFIDLFETALESDELIVRVTFPVPDCAAYRKMPNPASRYALVGVMVARFGSDVRVGVTGAGPCAFRAELLERALSERFEPQAVDDVEIVATDFNSDLHASAEYRANLLRVLTRRAVAELVTG
jgi:aerobic carbon-monoxide dehydrogenase medium subunit